MPDEEKKKIEFDPNKTWLGVGVKLGGTLFVMGFEETEGYIWHIATPTKYWFSTMALRMGAGLGGSVGIVAICVFNCDNPKVRLHNTELKDWGVNIAMSGKWSQVAKSLKNSGFWLRVGKLGVKGVKVLKDVEKTRNDLHYIYNALDIASSNGEPKVVVVDSPAGAGVELSIVYSLGKIEIM